MMVHYCTNKEQNIKYTLYAFFSDEEFRKVEITIDEIKSIFKTKKKKYITKYNSKIIRPKCHDINKFIKNRKLFIHTGRNGYGSIF